MSSLKEFQCEICGITSDNPIHWYVIECGDEKLAVIKWDLAAANSPTARHFCGEAHAQVYISRWFESICTPRKPVAKISREGGSSTPLHKSDCQVSRWEGQITNPAKLLSFRKQVPRRPPESSKMQLNHDAA